MARDDVIEMSEKLDKERDDPTLLVAELLNLLSEAAHGMSDVVWCIQWEVDLLGIVRVS